MGGQEAHHGDRRGCLRQRVRRRLFLSVAQSPSVSGSMDGARSILREELSKQTNESIDRSIIMFPISTSIEERNNCWNCKLNQLMPVESLQFLSSKKSSWTRRNCRFRDSERMLKDETR